MDDIIFIIEFLFINFCLFMFFNKSISYLKNSITIKFYSSFKKFYLTNTWIASANDQISLDISKSLSINQLFKIFEPNYVNLSANQTWYFTCYLLRLKYNEIYNKNESIHSNIAIANVQLQLDDKLYVEMNDIPNNFNYMSWCNSMISNINEFDDSQLCDCLLMISYLGISLHEKLFHQFLEVAYDRLHDMNIINMSKVLQAFLSFTGNNFKYTKYIIDKSKIIINNKISFSRIEMESFAYLLLNSNIKWMTKDTNKLFLDLFKRLLLLNQDLLTANNVGLFLRLCRMFVSITPEFRNDLSQTMIFLLNYSLKNLDNFSEDDIGEICGHLKYLNMYEEEVASKFELRSLELLKDCSRLSSLSNLMYSLSANTTLEVFKIFEAKLLPKLYNKKDSIDVILLSNIAENLADISLPINNIINVMHQLILFKTDLIIKYMSRFNKISKFLIYHKFTDFELEEKYVKALLTHLDKMAGIGYLPSAHFGIFFLTYECHSPLHFKAYNYFLKNIHKWDVNELCRLLLSLKRTKLKRHLYFKKKCQQIYSIVHSEILKKLPEISDIDLLNQVSKTIICTKLPIDPLISESILNKYATFTKNNDHYDLNKIISLNKIINIFSKYTYYHEDFFENLCENIYDKMDLSGFDALPLLQLISNVGYQPKNVENFTDAYIKMINKDVISNSIFNSLLVLHNLSKIQIFPAEKLSQYFTIDNIKNIEEYIEANPEHASHIERMLMELNRAVVLECPHLDIPWFHEQYWQEEILNKTTYPEESMIKFIKDEIYEILSLILTSENSLKRDTYSTYFHKIDFECIIDKNLVQMPIEKNSNILNNKVDLTQKLAINLLPESAFCCNSRILTGFEQMRKRHLQILDYAIIGIPYYEWNSMGLSTYSTRFKYIQDKLLNI